MKQQFATSKGIPRASVTKYETFGTVIGIMNDDSWKFYLQKCGRFEYTLPNQTKIQVELSVMSANEFWPTNVGEVRIF